MTLSLWYPFVGGGAVGGLRQKLGDTADGNQMLPSMRAPMLLQEAAVTWHCTICTWFSEPPQPSAEVSGAAQTEQTPGPSPEL